MDSKRPHQAETAVTSGEQRREQGNWLEQRETKGASTVSATFHSLKEKILKQIWQNVNIH